MSKFAPTKKIAVYLSLFKLPSRVEMRENAAKCANVRDVEQSKQVVYSVQNHIKRAIKISYNPIENFNRVNQAFPGVSN